MVHLHGIFLRRIGLKTMFIAQMEFWFSVCLSFSLCIYSLLFTFIWSFSYDVLLFLEQSSSTRSSIDFQELGTFVRPNPVNKRKVKNAKRGTPKIKTPFEQWTLLSIQCDARKFIVNEPSSKSLWFFSLAQLWSCQSVHWYLRVLCMYIQCTR